MNNVVYYSLFSYVLL